MISVVTPSFRQLDWLRLCVASVADQTGVTVEHIVQDAGSGFSQADLPPSSGLQLIVEKDAGMYDAINRGLRRARGEICAYLNSDEQYLPGTLRTVAEAFAAEPDVDLLFGDTILTDRNGSPMSYRRTIVPELEHVRMAHLNSMSAAMFFRRRLIDRGVLFDPEWKSIGDQVWIEQLLREGVRMKALGVPLATFTWTGANLSADLQSRREAMLWRNRNSFTRTRWLRAVARHRWQKFLAGAYRRRDVAIDLYTLVSPNHREAQIARAVTYRWPDAPSLTSDKPAPSCPPQPSS